jgi:glycosyltransferase involved in cell wall biosynthesis
MISIITPTYNTSPDVLARTWNSLKQQTFTDWEWVIWDDSTNEEAWRQLYGFCSDERYKISMHRSHVHSGSIGDVKRNGFMVAKGDILLELDHDDELYPDCLDEVAKAFSDQTIGFVYSDWCEILENGVSGRYPEGWGFGYGSDYWSEEHGVWAMSAPEINPTTMKHIVSAPNHVRAWRADVYRKLNGHNPAYVVADDYELVVRTFLETKFLHINKLLYKQHIGPSTAQRQRNALIQDLVVEISSKYSDMIDSRFEELNEQTENR